VRQAVARQDFGSILKAYRESFSPPVTQSALGSWLCLSQAQVSRIESGRTPVTDLEKLTRWSVVVGIPNSTLWFTLHAASVSATAKEKRVDGGDVVIGPQGNAGSAQLRTLALDPALDRVESEDSRFRDGRAILGVLSVRIVGVDDVEVIRETTRAFRQIDNRFGGGHIRGAVSAYLATEVQPAMRDDRFARGARRHFRLASVELHQLAGWMAYDVGDKNAGKQHLRDALGIASEAGDDALTAEMLAAMSHQAAFSRRSGEAIDLAIAARRSAARSGAPALHAESFALEAQGLALQRDTRGCISALQKAERAFLTATSENTPQWLHYFDIAYLSAKFAQALRDLGRPVDAERFARESLQVSDGYERGSLFNTALLASILADRGQIEEAVRAARSAVQMAGQVRSARARGYLRDVGIRMLAHESREDVGQLLKEMTVLGI